MLTYESEIWSGGHEYVAGVDEAGRGCLFGDVVAAAVILPKHEVINGINDSKQLSEKKRNELYEIIQKKAISIGIGRVAADIIDEINIKEATRLAMKRAVEQLTVRPDHVFIDAEQMEMNVAQTTLIKGDQLSQSIAAASIIAKVTRDRLCLKWDEQYPGYGIAKHKGYGTKRHREQIKALGVSKLHRHTFLKFLSE